MTDQRWKEVQENDDVKLTLEEIAEGWHFCWEFDGLLVGPGMGEQRFCTSACGATVTVSPNVKPETLSALTEMAKLASKQFKSP